MAIRSRDSRRTRYRLQSWFWTILRVISFSFLTFLKVSANDRKITCTIPSVEPLQDTVLTCHFPEDLRLTKKDFTVYHYVNKSKPEVVLDCWWLRGTLDCYSKPGFIFNKSVSTYLSATVTRVNNTHEGSYTCQVAGYGPSSLGTCEFQLKLDGKTTCTIPSVEPLQDTVLTCHFPEDLRLAKKDFTVYHYVNNNNPDAVLDCYWVRGMLDCFSNLGFILDKSVSTYLSATVTRVNNTHEGSYACEAAGYGPSSMGTCEFQLKLDGKTTCSIPSVEPLQDTVLTCHFPEDLGLTKKDFTVYHYVNKSKPDSVLDCWWVRGTLDCYSKPGFIFDKSVSTYVSVTVTRVNNAHEGSYACQVAGYKLSSLGTCKFQLKLDRKTTCTIPSVEPLQDTVLTCHFSEDLGLTKKNFTVYHYVNKCNPDAVLDCWWLGGKLDCFSKLGFIIDKSVSTYVSVTVTRVNSTHEGFYACQVAGYGPNSLGTCEFQLKMDGKTTCTIPSVEPLQDTVLTCHFPEDLRLMKKDFTVYHYVNKNNPDRQTFNSIQFKSIIIIIVIIIKTIKIIFVYNVMIFSRRSTGLLVAGWHIRLLFEAWVHLP